jgi:hypothetical protein
LRKQDLELAEKQEKGERWDKLDLSQFSNKITYGTFVWNKIAHVFPDLA